MKWLDSNQQCEARQNYLSLVTLRLPLSPLPNSPYYPGCHVCRAILICPYRIHLFGPIFPDSAKPQP